MNILVLQPYINRTVDSINETGMRAYRVYCEVSGRYYETDNVVTIPKEVLRLFDIDGIDPEDKILGDDMFILSEYIREIDRADLIILLQDEYYWEYGELNLFSNVTSCYPRLERHCFKVPYFDLMLPNHKEYNRERAAMRHDPTDCRELLVPENLLNSETSSDTES